MNILIIRSCAVGDFVLNLPALQALQKCHSGAEFTLVGNPATLELAREFVRVAGIYSIEAEPWRRLFYEPITLSPLSFERAIVWMKNPVVADNLRLSGTLKVERADPFPTSGHAAAHLINTLNLEAPELPDWWIGRESSRVILHPGSGSPKKCWPGFMDLALRLQNVGFLIGPAEADFDTGHFPRYENLSLREVAALLAGSAGFIGNDSGITHLAGYLGCPTIALFGPTDPLVWGPLGRRVRILRNTDLAAIRVDDVCDGLGAKL